MVRSTLMSALRFLPLHLHRPSPRLWTVHPRRRPAGRRTPTAPRATDPRGRSGSRRRRCPSRRRRRPAGPGRPRRRRCSYGARDPAPEARPTAARPPPSTRARHCRRRRPVRAARRPPSRRMASGLGFDGTGVLLPSTLSRELSSSHSSNSLSFTYDQTYVRASPI